ncbi:MAG: hypothetical protein AAF429_07810 [Pseudomonadota bacterium]
MRKGNLDIDPRGLIYESYRIDGLGLEEARSIFLDWAMERAADDMRPQLEVLLEEYGDAHPDHPMTQVIREGLNASEKPRRRGGRLGRKNYRV